MRKLFLALLILGLVLILGLGVFVFYYYPHFVRPRLSYQEAVKLYENGDYVSAAMTFESMSGYSNSTEYAKRSWEAAGNAAYEAKEYALAKAYYTKANADSSVFAGIDSAYFELGSAAYEDGDHLLGESYFLCVDAASEYQALMDPIRINYAAGLVENDDFTTAESVLAVCSEDNNDEIADLWFAGGESKLHIWDIASADTCFARALTRCSDKAEMQQKIKALWMEASELAESEGNYTLAEKCVSRAGDSYDVEDRINGAAYREAMALYNDGDLIAALDKFTSLGDYEDSADYIEKINTALAGYYVAGGSIFYATLDHSGRVALHGDWEIYTAPDWKDITKLSVGFYRFMLGIKPDGNVVGSGNGTWGNLNVSDWRNIVQTACGDMHSVGLKEDGTVVACGRDYYGQVSHTSTWTDIIQVDAGISFTAGLKADGTVVAVGENTDGQCSTGDMNDIIQIACGARHTVALKSDGTVVACGLNDDGQCNVSGWRDIVAVYAGAYHTVGVRSDGGIIATGSNSYGECNVRDYKNPVCVSCGANFTLIMLSDGTEIKLGAINNVD